jgi:hypothetical protein
VGAPQFEQKRTLGVTYAPHLEQVIGFYLVQVRKDACDEYVIESLANTKRGGDL